MWIMAVCAVLGGLDRLLGNRFGLGKAFESGFEMLGPIALSMTGIVCMAPVLSALLGPVITPVFRLIGQDPAMFGSILAIDMGGWGMATSLAADETVGRFAGTAAAAILGCTMCFTIPVGMGMFERETRQHFAQGILYGLIAMPAAMFLGAVLGGIPVPAALWLCVPVAVLAVLIAFFLRRFPDGTLRVFSGFAWLLKAVTTAGLALGVFQYLTGLHFIPHMLPVEEAMKTISAIGLMLLGSLPMAEILKKLLRVPFDFLGKRIGIGGDGVMCMLLFYMNATPGLVALKDVSPRAQVAAGAFAVCAASGLTAHFAFCMDKAPEWAAPVLIAKLAGAVLGAALALVMWKERKAPQTEADRG